MTAHAEIVAYRTSEGIICTDDECLAHFASLDAMRAARPMTQADISEEQNNRDGRSVCCESCMVYLDLWNLTMGARS